MSNGIPRRRSLFGGLFWLLIGTLLLINNIRPEFGFFDLVRHWWPALLILWGVVRLAESTVLRKTGEIPTRTFSGGEIFLVILLIVIGSGISIGNRIRQEEPDINIQFPWDRSYSATEEIKADKPLPAGSLVTVSNYRGSITIVPDPSSLEVRVVAQKFVRFGNESQAQNRMAQNSVEIVQKEKGIEIRPKLTGGATGNRTVEVNLEVHIPQKSSVDLKTERGDIRVTGLVGTINAETQRGEIDIKDAGGDVIASHRGNGRARIDGVKGNATLKGRGNEVEISNVTGEALVDGEFYGPIRIKNAAKGARFASARTDLTIGPLQGGMEISSGDLEIHDTTGNVLLTSNEKDVRLTNIGGRIKISNRTGNIEVTLGQPPKEEVDIQNDSGNIELALPAASGFDLSASTRSGEIENGFSDSAFKSTEEGGSARLEGKHGQRGPQVKLQTRYGSVKLRKSS
ncbi:MAG: DUF4097 family beta strand repeat protein [Acidobacteria bacterium]|nr:DUF4097 family beta strand repeat protein [Acidobacteriota bacterium]